MRIRVILLCLAAIMTVAGCGVSYDADLMVSFEARWMCDVQRSVYEDLDTLTLNFDERLAGNGLDAEVYRSFKDDLTDDIELRNRVSAEYEAYCAG